MITSRLQRIYARAGWISIIQIMTSSGRSSGGASAQLNDEQLAALVAATPCPLDLGRGRPTTFLSLLPKVWPLTTVDEDPRNYGFFRGSSSELM